MEYQIELIDDHVELTTCDNVLYRRLDNGEIIVQFESADELVILAIPLRNIKFFKVHQDAE